MTPAAPVRLTRDQIAAFRLSRHHLSARAPLGSLASVAGGMAGAQAQLLGAAQMSLRARVRDLRIQHVDDALRERNVVKAWCMRRTLHLIPSQDLSIFVRGSAARAEREVRWVLGKGVSARALERLIAAVLDALDRPLTRREMAERVSRALRVRPSTHRGGGWGSRAEIPAIPFAGLTFPMVYLLHLAGARGVICSGPPRGNEPTFVRADAWVPRWRDAPKDHAERELLRRYLRAFGPAAPADFASWTGMPLRDALRIWQREEPDLVPVTVEGRRAAILRDDLETLEAAELVGSPVRLLPYFDAFLLGHKERAHLVAPAHHRSVYRDQGWVAPVVLAAGRIAGVWAHAREGDRLRVTVRPFGSVPRRVMAGIREEAEDVGRFLGASLVDLRRA
jgi:hypothetical protein